MPVVACLEVARLALEPDDEERRGGRLTGVMGLLDALCGSHSERILRELLSTADDTGRWVDGYGPVSHTEPFALLCNIYFWGFCQSLRNGIGDTTTTEGTS